MDIKLTGDLYAKIVRDLARPHPFAAERVGFVFGRVGTLTGQAKVILLNRYHSIPDCDYVDDPTVGARIGVKVLTWAMQALYQRRQVREGIFHVHMHPHRGETQMSGVDKREIPRMMPGFQSVSREAAHGIIVFSHNHCSGWVWLPGNEQPIEASSVSVIGTPVEIFRRGVRDEH
jgi:hypothetical protein